jgi:two-component system, response regulator / RNA-binding antiterminator
MTPSQPLLLVLVTPDSLYPHARDAHAMRQAERSRILRIGLLENG